MFAVDSGIGVMKYNMLRTTAIQTTRKQRNKLITKSIFNKQIAFSLYFMAQLFSLCSLVSYFLSCFSFAICIFSVFFSSFPPFWPDDVSYARKWRLNWNDWSNSGYQRFKSRWLLPATDEHKIYALHTVNYTVNFWEPCEHKTHAQVVTIRFLVGSINFHYM